MQAAPSYAQVMPSYGAAVQSSVSPASSPLNARASLLHSTINSNLQPSAHRRCGRCFTRLAQVYPPCHAASLRPSSLVLLPSSAGAAGANLYTLDVLAILSSSWAITRPSASGLLTHPVLPSFFPLWTNVMASRLVPGTPRVISPSPDISDVNSYTDGYFEPIKTRSSARRSPQPSRLEDLDDASDTDERARSRSRSRDAKARRRRLSGLASTDVKGTMSSKSTNKASEALAVSNESATGHLSPYEVGKEYLRRLSRSPSPLGLIPIHREWRSFVGRSVHCDEAPLIVAGSPT